MKKVMIVCFVGWAAFVQGYGDVVLPAYSNTITHVDQIYGQTRYTLVLECSNRDPIINYVPETYQDFEEQEVTRLYMPQTTIGYDFNDNIVSVVPYGSGVEIVLFGRVLDKIVSEYKIVIILECAT